VVCGVFGFWSGWCSEVDWDIVLVIVPKIVSYLFFGVVIWLLLALYSRTYHADCTFLSAGRFALPRFYLGANNLFISF
jgi:hypothetical protein